MNNDNEINILKKLFSHSSENVFILSYDFEVLWSNKDELLRFFGGESFAGLRNGRTLPLKSGEYALNFSGMEFSCGIINYPELSIYVLQMSGEDAMFESVKSTAVRNYFHNRTAQIREAVSGISTAVKMFRDLLDEKSVEKINDYLNVTTGKCNMLLRSAQNPEELIKYTEDMPESVNIDLTGFLNNFADICRKVLDGKIEMTLNAQPELHISADPDRLTACMLALTVLAGKSVPDCQNITIDAKSLSGYALITVSPQKKTEQDERRLMSRFETLYKEAASDSDLFVVYRFCRTYNGMFFIADAPENNGRIYSVKLPLSDNTDSVFSLSSHVPYYDEPFSKYRIALSAIADIF